MSKEILNEIERLRKALPEPIRRKFAVAKSRFKEKGATEDEAIMAAAAKFNILVGMPSQISVIDGAATVNGADNIPTTDNSVTESMNNTDITTSHNPPKDTVIITDNTPLSGNTPSPVEAAGNDNYIGKIIQFPRHNDLYLEVPEPVDNTFVAEAPPPITGENLPKTVTYAMADATVSLSVVDRFSWTHSNGVIDQAQITGDSHLTVSIAKAVLGSVGLAICTTVLVYLGAQAGGFGTDAWFWSAFSEVAGAICLIIPIRGFWRSAVTRIFGVLVLAIGYFAMHTAIDGNTHRTIATSVSQNEEVKILETQIKNLENVIAPQLQTVEGLDPVESRTARQRLLSSIEPDRKELASLQSKLIEARKALKNDSSITTARHWGIVEWLRRLALMIVNIMSGHLLLASLPVIMKTRAQRVR